MFGSSKGASVIAMDVKIGGEVRGNGDKITWGLEVTVRIWLYPELFHLMTYHKEPSQFSQLHSIPLHVCAVLYLTCTLIYYL